MNKSSMQNAPFLNVNMVIVGMSFGDLERNIFDDFVKKRESANCVKLYYSNFNNYF